MSNNQEMPNPDHPAWQKVCPFSNMTHATCNKGDTPDGMSPEHLAWHCDRFVELGLWEVVPGMGADDPSLVAYRETELGKRELPGS